MSPRLRPFGAWVEQLIAESTGKSGRGIVPVDGEPVAPPTNYENDRFFVALWLKGEHAPEHERAVQALAEAGHPVIRWEVGGEYGLSGEFLRWEIATVIMGAVLDIDPFDEPNVAEAKAATRRVLDRHADPGAATPARERDGSLLLYTPSGSAVASFASSQSGTVSTSRNTRSAPAIAMSAWLYWFPMIAIGAKN